MTTNNPPLKILHILDHSLPLHSGYAFRSHDIFRAQLKKGWQPVALTSPKHGASWKGLPRTEETIDGVRYYRTAAVTRGTVPMEAEWRLMIALAGRIRQVVEIEKPDLLHAHSPVLTALPALWVGRKVGIPVVYEIRAFWEDAAAARGTYGQDSWKYKLGRSLETWACRKADQVTVLSRGLKDDLTKRGISSEKVSIVFNGVNADDFKACTRDAEYFETWRLARKKVIGFIGSFFRYEGLDLLVRAVARLTATRSDIVLILVGGGEMEAQLQAQIKQLSLENKVVMAGSIPHDRIPGIYALVDVLAYPRYSTRLTELVTPLKPLEAMAMGKALVASDIGGHRELIRHGHTGLLFPPGNVTALAGELERLLADQTLRQNLQKQGCDWVCQEHSWDKTTAVYCDIYAAALGKKLDSRPPGGTVDQRSCSIPLWRSAAGSGSRVARL
jgi:PEP-CTERM/exosortase A-associated glycosyltransferase